MKEEKQNTDEDEAVTGTSSPLFKEPLFSPQLSRIWGPTSSPTCLAGSGDNQWLLPPTSRPELPDQLARGILTGAKQCGLKQLHGYSNARKGSTGDGTWEAMEDIVDREGSSYISSSSHEDVVDTDYKFGPSILWLDQVNSYEENNCTVEIGKGYLDGVLTHEFLMQRHGQVVNCACGHNVDALKVAKQGVNLAKDLQSLYICSPSTIVMHRHCVRVLTPCTELSLQELLSTRRNLREGLEEHARFLAACLVEAATFLHARNILHRDVAPHNVFLDYRGYAKLANFHHAVCGAPGQYFKGYCGTLGYQAPEVVACLGHMHTLDYWGIGAVVYQFLFGFSPFADEDLGRLRSKTVLNPEFAITRLGNRFRHVSHHGQDAIKSMLCKYPHKRLGYRYQEANKIKWFHPYRWTSLSRQQMNSPLISFLEEELETSTSASFHCPVSRSTSSSEMDMRGGSWEIHQHPPPPGSWQQHQQGQGQQGHQQETSPSSSTSNCSQGDDSNRSVLFHKMFGRAPGDNVPVANSNQAEEETATCEKYLMEKSEKDASRKEAECSVDSAYVKDAPNAKTAKNMENLQRQVIEHEHKYKQTNYSQSPSKLKELPELTKKLPDPNTHPYIAAQFAAGPSNGSYAEGYVNAHIIAAAHLLQYGNQQTPHAMGWNSSSSGFIQQASMQQNYQQQHHMYTPMYNVPQYSMHQQQSLWNPAEGDGINQHHQNQPTAHHNAVKTAMHNGTHTWAQKSAMQNSNGGNSCQISSGQSTTRLHQSTASNNHDSNSQNGCQAKDEFCSGAQKIVEQTDDEQYAASDSFEDACQIRQDETYEGTDGANDSSDITPKGKVVRYYRVAPRLPPRFIRKL